MMHQVFIQAPMMDWMEKAGLYSRLQTWQRDIEFIFRGPLNKESIKAKANYLICWLGQRLKNHLLSQNSEFTDYKEIFRVLKEWCNPKQNRNRTKLRDLRQGSLSLSEFINTAQLLVQECKYSSDSDRLLRDIIVSEVNSITAYKSYIDIDINLTLENATKVCMAEDSTRRQIESLRPDLTKRRLDTPALEKKRYINSIPDAVHQKEHLSNASTQNVLNPHNLTTPSASSVGAYRHTKIEPNF